MDRSEPTLVPEWYKGTGSGSNSNPNNQAKSSSHSDEHGTSLLSRNRLSLNVCDKEAPRSLAFADRGSSSFRRSASINGSINHDKDSSSHSRTYSNFSRSHRDKDREKDFDLRDRGRSHFLDNEDRTEKRTFRRSQTMIAGQYVESWPKGPEKDLNNAIHSAGRTIRGIGKTSFERDFPSLGAEEKQGLSDVSRVPSPGLSGAIQSLPICSSVMLGIDDWTSALVAPPPKVGGSGPVLTSASHTGTSNLAPTSLSTMTGLNMAEALIQAPNRVRNSSELSIDAQRIDELTRIQYSKLIPVTPTAPKSLVLNPSDKLKSKKIGDSVVSVRIGQQQSGQAGSSQALRAPVAKSDSLKMPVTGNFQVLNREKGVVSSAAKDGSNLTNASRGVTPIVVVPSASVPPIKSPINPKGKIESTKGTYTSAQVTFGEKGPLHQAQKRNDFFNSIRKKAAMNQPVVIPEPSSARTLSNSEKLSLPPGVPSDNLDKENHVSSSEKDLSKDCDANEDVSDINEEEVKFMESLGWNKNDRINALTPEEIADFEKKHGKLKPSRFGH